MRTTELLTFWCGVGFWLVRSAGTRPAQYPVWGQLALRLS
jgi:hypothetical protein